MPLRLAQRDVFRSVVVTLYFVALHQTLVSLFARMVATTPKHFRSDIDNYLANLSVGFKETRRLLDLFKRERARDDGL